MKKNLTLMWRWSLFTSVLIGICHWAWQHIIGPMPKVWVEIGWWPIHLYKEYLPTWLWTASQHSRWLGVLAGPIWVCAVLALFPKLDRGNAVKEARENRTGATIFGTVVGVVAHILAIGVGESPGGLYIALACFTAAAGWFAIWNPKNVFESWACCQVFILGLTFPVALFRGLVTGLLTASLLSITAVVTALPIPITRVSGSWLTRWLFLTQEKPSESPND